MTLEEMDDIATSLVKVSILSRVYSGAGITIF
jgi:hypothetical protein